jgi:hypothetical protein
MRWSAPRCPAQIARIARPNRKPFCYSFGNCASILSLLASPPRDSGNSFLGIAEDNLMRTELPASDSRKRESKER